MTAPGLRSVTQLPVYIDGDEHSCTALVKREGTDIAIEVLSMPTIKQRTHMPSIRTSFYKKNNRLTLRSARLFLHPFRDPTTTGTEAENYPVYPPLSCIKLVAPSGDDHTINAALNSTVRSLLRDQRSQFGSRPIREISLGFSKDCTKEDYYEAPCSINHVREKYGQIVEHLELWPLHMTDGPALESLLSDPYFLGAVGTTAVTIKSAGATGYPAGGAFVKAKHTPRPSALGPPPTTVTIEFSHSQGVPDYKRVARHLHSQPRLDVLFIGHHGPMKAFTAAVNTERDRLDDQSSFLSP